MVRGRKNETFPNVSHRLIVVSKSIDQPCVQFGANFFLMSSMPVKDIVIHTGVHIAEYLLKKSASMNEYVEIDWGRYRLLA